MNIRILAVLAAMPFFAPASHGQLFQLTRDQLVSLTKENTFERFPDGRPKIPDSLIERAKGMSMEEVFAVVPAAGYRNQYADGFHILYPKKKMVGRAFTVQFMPARPDLDAVINANGRIYNQIAIDMVQPGDVFVVDLFGKGADATIVGDNLFYYLAKVSKAAGRYFGNRHAGVLPQGPSELPNERDHHGHQRAGAHW
jgi:4-hydroxy-4-methyl-2-oxoglutarate aldolase